MLLSGGEGEGAPVMELASDCVLSSFSPVRVEEDVERPKPPRGLLRWVFFSSVYREAKSAIFLSFK